MARFWPRASGEAIPKDSKAVTRFDTIGHPALRQYPVRNESHGEAGWIKQRLVDGQREVLRRSVERVDVSQSRSESGVRSHAASIATILAPESSRMRPAASGPFRDLHMTVRLPEVIGDLAVQTAQRLVMPSAG